MTFIHQTSDVIQRQHIPKEYVQKLASIDTFNSWLFANNVSNQHIGDPFLVVESDQEYIGRLDSLTTWEVSPAFVNQHFLGD